MQAVNTVILFDKKQPTLMHLCKIMRDNISLDRQNTLKRDNANNMKPSSLKMYILSRFSFNMKYLPKQMFMSKWFIIWALQ